MDAISSMLKISLAISLFLLVGCAEFTHNWNGNSATYSEPYAQADFDELLAFGATMAKVPSSARAETCRTLLKRQQESPRAGFLLHLLVGRLLSDSCGDISKILEATNAIPSENLQDERLQKLLVLDTEILKRMNSQTNTTPICTTKKSTAQKRKQKSSTTAVDGKETGASSSSNDEARLLREKLEAIRSMEKHLDESGGGN
jgi:hypothetical protein